MTYVSRRSVRQGSACARTEQKRISGLASREERKGQGAEGSKGPGFEEMQISDCGLRSDASESRVTRHKARKTPVAERSQPRATRWGAQTKPLFRPMDRLACTMATWAPGWIGTGSALCSEWRPSPVCSTIPAAAKTTRKCQQMGSPPPAQLPHAADKHGRRPAWLRNSETLKTW